MAEPIRMLFVCVENACRSQIAEAFARHHGAGRVDAFSAGSKPRGSVDATAIEVMREKGLELGAHGSKGFDALPNVEWDVVVGMGCGDACAFLPAKRHLSWQIPDPKQQPLGVYRQIRDLIERAVKELVEQSLT